MLLVTAVEERSKLRDMGLQIPDPFKNASRSEYICFDIRLIYPFDLDQQVTFKLEKSRKPCSLKYNILRGTFCKQRFDLHWATIVPLNCMYQWHRINSHFSTESSSYSAHCQIGRNRRSN